MEIPKKRRRFSKEKWMELLRTIREEKKSEEVPEEKKEDAKVEVHIHNNMPTPEFMHSKNQADAALERMVEDNRRKWSPL